MVSTCAQQTINYPYDKVQSRANTDLWIRDLIDFDPVMQPAQNTYLGRVLVLQTADDNLFHRRPARHNHNNASQCQTRQQRSVCARVCYRFNAGRKT